MDAREELVSRCARRRRAKLGTLSDEGYGELVRAVRADPDRFADDPEEQAFLEVAKGLERLDSTGGDDDMLDDDEYLRERRRRLDRLLQSCDRALAVDPSCVDARLLSLLAADKDPDALLGLLLELDQDVTEESGPLVMPGSGNAWDDVFCHPRLRVQAAVARTCLDTARYRMASRTCEDLLGRTPSDELGGRYTYALALARLEDETGFDALDARFGRHGNAWLHLGRVLLLYKLDRMGAARRALAGFDELCEGGAYVLLRPVYVDTYLPDRPAFQPGSFEEATMAVHEADPIVVDAPGFVTWASEQPGMTRSAEGFAESQGYDW